MTWERSSKPGPFPLPVGRRVRNAVFNGMWKELNDNDDFKEDTVSNYFADSMTGRREALPPAHQRLLREGIFRRCLDRTPGITGPKEGPGAKLRKPFLGGHHQGDRCGCHQVNA